jgi:hypothetical protein
MEHCERRLNSSRPLLCAHKIVRVRPIQNDYSSGCVCNLRCVADVSLADPGIKIMGSIFFWPLFKYPVLFMRPSPFALNTSAWEVTQT